MYRVTFKYKDGSFLVGTSNINKEELRERMKSYLMEEIKENDMYTLQQIKDRYYTELALYDTERRGLEQYIREEYTPVYDEELSFLGWEKQNVNS